MFFYSTLYIPGPGERLAIFLKRLSEDPKGLEWFSE